MSDGTYYQVKASVFRAYIKWIEREGKLAVILPRLTPDTAKLVKTPPLASTWMRSAPLDELVEQIELFGGIEAVKRAGTDTLRDEMGPVLAPMVKNILRLIGASPATLYRHWDDLVKTAMRDVEWSWRATSDNSGMLAMRYPNGRNVALRTFCSTIAGLEHGLVLCGRRGVVGNPIRTDHNAAEFEIRWS